MENSIKRRLDALPRKVAIPLTRLAELGQLQPDLLEAVLDAGEITGHTQHLLGFAAGAASLERRHVPVIDTVRMARKIGASIRLDWSPRRWREEHDHLSRIMAFLQLASKNVRYDISEWRAKLPRVFPGYVVSSSRRLGAIGVVQRHCVASYHDRIMAGRLAIVCVFLDKVRWTVEVSRSDDPDMPVIIRQIKTTDNRQPDEFEEMRIHDALGIGMGIPVLRREKRRSNVARVCGHLQAAGISQVVYRYDPTPGMLPQPPLCITPDNVDISGHTVDVLELIPDAEELRTVNCSVHDWLSGFFEERRDYYRDSVQLYESPADILFLFCEIRFAVQECAVHVKWIVRSNKPFARPRERTWIESAGRPVTARIAVGRWY